MDSTSDQRIENNVMRHEYKLLSDAEKADMQAIKDAGLTFFTLVDRIGNDIVRTASTPAGSRELSLAKTKIEEAVMWAVKHITK